MKIVEKIKREPVKAALTVILIFQIFLIALSNIFLLDKNLDVDTGKLFGHVTEMWRQKMIVLPDWSYMTTLEWDCSSLLALPFLAITHDIFLSFGLANIIFLLCFLCMIFFLFKGEDLLYPLLCTNLLIIPFRIGMLDYYNMLFFGGAQYIIKASVPLLLAGLLLYVNERSKEEISVSAKLLMAVYLGLLFLCSASSGVYVFICGIIPVFIAYSGYKFLRWERMPCTALFLICSSVVLMFIGWKINTAIMSGRGGASGNSMTFCSIYQLLASICGCFFGIFELYGGITESMELQILSMEGIQLLAKFALTTLMLMTGIIHIIRYIAHPAEMLRKENLRNLLLLFIFVWNLFVLVISFPRGGSVTYEYRYHIIGMLPLMCVTGSSLIGCIRKMRTEQRNWLYGAGFLAILFLCSVSYKELYTKEDKYADLWELCAYTKELGAEHIYLYNDPNESDICRVMDETSSYIGLLEDGTTYVFDYYSCYVNAFMETSNAVVVVKDKDYQFGDTFEIAGYSLSKFASVGNRSLYYFTDNL